MYHECDIVFPLFFYFSLLPFILFLVRVNQLAMKLLLLFFFNYYHSYYYYFFNFTPVPAFIHPALIHQKLHMCV